LLECDGPFADCLRIIEPALSAGDDGERRPRPRHNYRIGGTAGTLGRVLESRARAVVFVAVVQ
jgi:hypothetical protein